MFLRQVLSFDVWGDPEYPLVHLPIMHTVQAEGFMYAVQASKPLCVYDEGEALLYSAGEALCV